MAFLKKVVVGGAIIAALTVSARPATKRIAFAVTARAPANAVYDALCDPAKLFGATSASSPPTAAPRVVVSVVLELACCPARCASC